MDEREKVRADVRTVEGVNKKVETAPGSLSKIKLNDGAIAVEALKESIT